MELRRELETSGENASWTEHQLREEANQKRVELEEEIARLSHDHKLKVKNLKDVQDDEMKKLDSLKEQELKVRSKYNMIYIILWFHYHGPSHYVFPILESFRYKFNFQSNFAGLMFWIVIL